MIQLGFNSYVRREDPDSKSRDVARSGKTGRSSAALWTVVIVGGALGLGVSGLGLFGLLLAMVMVGTVFGLYVHRRAGGLTGDFMGALQQISELGILFALVSVS